MDKLLIILFLAISTNKIGENNSLNDPIFHDGEVSDSIFIKVKTIDDQMHWFINMDLGEKYCWNHLRYEILSKQKKKLDNSTH